MSNIDLPASNISNSDGAMSLQEAIDAPRKMGIEISCSHVGTLSDSELGTMKEALARHGLLCLSGQEMTARQLHDFTSRWSEVVILSPGLANTNQEPGLPSITRVGNLRPDDSIIPNLSFAEYWHHDGDFWAPGKNFIVNFLSSVRVPSVGGNTGFMDMQRAYQELTDEERVLLESAFIVVRASEISDFQKADPEEIPPDAAHPVVMHHPLSGAPALYLPESRTGIQRADGTEICSVSSLLDRFESSLGIFEHSWSPGDLLIMDNLQIMHRGMGGYGDHPRLLYRCQARLEMAAN